MFHKNNYNHQKATYILNSKWTNVCIWDAHRIRLDWWIMYIFNLCKKYLLLATISSAFFIAGCATYTENGELVRHHFGYVKVITPAVHAPEAAVRSLEVETYGIWVYMGGHSGSEQIRGFGTGFGYQYDRRDFIPLDCRVVIRVKNQEDFKKILKEIQNNEHKEGGICIIRD
jgi:hypothetical protein